MTDSYAAPEMHRPHERPDFQARYEAACHAAEDRHEPLMVALVARGVRRADCYVDQTGGMVFCFRLQLAGTDYVQASIEQDDRGTSCVGYMAGWDDERDGSFLRGHYDGQHDFDGLANLMIGIAVQHGYALEPRKESA